MWKKTKALAELIANKGELKVNMNLDLSKPYIQQEDKRIQQDVKKLSKAQVKKDSSVDARLNKMMLDQKLFSTRSDKRNIIKPALKH